MADKQPAPDDDGFIADAVPDADGFIADAAPDADGFIADAAPPAEPLDLHGLTGGAAPTGTPVLTESEFKKGQGTEQEASIADMITAGGGGLGQGIAGGMRAPLDYATGAVEQGLEHALPIDAAARLTSPESEAIPRGATQPGIDSGELKSEFEQSLEATRDVRRESEDKARGLHAAGEFSGSLLPVAKLAKAAGAVGRLGSTAAGFVAPQIFRNTLGKGIELGVEGYLTAGALSAAQELDKAIETGDYAGAVERMPGAFHHEGKLGAGLNVGLGGALGLITKRYNAQSVQERANELGFKGLGGKKRDIFLANTRIPGGGNAVSQQALEDGVISWKDSSIEGTAERAAASRLRYGKELEAVREEAAALVGDQGGPSLSGLADKIEQDVIAPAYKNEVTRDHAVAYRAQHKHLLQALEEHRPAPLGEAPPMLQDPEQLAFLNAERPAALKAGSPTGEQGSLFGDRGPADMTPDPTQMGLFPYEAPKLGPNKKEQLAQTLGVEQGSLFSRRYPEALGPQPGQLPLPGTGPGPGQLPLLPPEPPVLQPGPGRKGQLDLLDTTPLPKGPPGLELPPQPPPLPTPEPPPNRDVLDMQRLNDWRMAMDDKAKWSSPEAQPQADLARKTRHAMDEYWMDSVEQAANRAGDPGLIDRVKDLKLKYAKAAVASDLIEETAARKAANRTFSMSDTQVGQVAALAADAKTGGLVTAAKGVLGAVGNKLLRERGNFTQAAALHGAAKRAVKAQARLKRSAALRGIVGRKTSPSIAIGAALQAKDDVDVEKAVEHADKLQDPESDEAQKTTSYLQEVEVDGGPQLAQALGKRFAAQTQFLLEKAGPPPQPSPFGGKPPKREFDPETQQQLSRYLAPLNNPADALARVGDGEATPEDYEVLEDQYPKMWQEFQQTAVHGLADKDLDYDQQVAVADALKLPLLPQMSGSYMAFWQDVAVQGQMQDEQKAEEEEAAAKANLSGGKNVASKADRTATV